MSRQIRRPAAALSAVVAAGAAALLALTSCGVQPRHTINAASASHQIAAQLAARYPVGTPTVSCPAGVADTVGQTFECSANLDGQPIQLHATVTGAGGRFTFSSQSVIVAVDSVVATLTGKIQDQTHVRAAVDCGHRSVLVIAVGNSFQCSVTAPGVPDRTATVTVVDNLGDTTVDLPAAP